MQVKTNTTVERIIAKIDNDFNPDNSDWIPRVGAWCIDAMSQLDVLRSSRKRKKVTVKDRIAYSECPITDDNLKVYDNNGCEIKKASDSSGCCNAPSTGKVASATSDSITEFTPDTINVIKNNQANSAPDYLIAETLNSKEWPGRYRINEFNYGSDTSNNEKNYVLVDCNKLELNFDADYIYIETEYIDTIISEAFGCEVPIIPNNGLLIEAITYYCMYKMLCRGYTHPVFNLHASQYGTNPFYQWTQLKDEAKRSVINNDIDISSVDDIWRSNFYIDTFNPRS